MFIKLRVKYEGTEFEIHLHEAVYIAQELATELIKELEPDLVDLVVSDQEQFDNAELTSPEELPSAIAKILVPFTVGPLTTPKEYLYVAKELADNKSKVQSQKHMGMLINGQIVAIRMADKYAADFGSLQAVARQLYESCFDEKWKDEGFGEIFEILHQAIAENYEKGEITPYARELDEHINEDLNEGLREFYSDITEEELVRAEAAIRASSVLEDAIPYIMEGKKNNIAE